MRYAHPLLLLFSYLVEQGESEGGDKKKYLDRSDRTAYTYDAHRSPTVEKEITMTEIHFERAELRDGLDPDAIKILASSIKEDGLLQAIVIAKRDTGGYKLIAGRRRLAAMMYLGWTKTPARIIAATEIDELPALAENLMRLQMNPLEEAHACQLLHDQKGLSIGDIAARTHHGTSWVQDRLALLSLPDNFKEAVGHRRLSISAAMLLQEVTDIELRDYYLHLCKVNGATVQQVQAWVLEWRARQTLTGADTYGKPIPQAPPRSQRQQQSCGFCDNAIPLEAELWIPTCRDCYDETLKLKASRDDDLTPTQPTEKDAPH